jgi:hypothetical protein
MAFVKYVILQLKKWFVIRSIRRRYAKLEKYFDRLENAPASKKIPRKSFKERLEALGSGKESC